MRKKKTLKVSINEIKKYCPFIKNVQLFYNSNENKNNVVLSVMSNLCPIGKAINEKHLIIIDNKSKINIFKILRKSNIISRHLVDSLDTDNEEIDIKTTAKCDEEGSPNKIGTGNTCRSSYGITTNFRRNYDNTRTKAHGTYEEEHTSHEACLCDRWNINYTRTNMHPIVENKQSSLLTEEGDSNILFHNQCSKDLKELINKLFLDKRYRVFTILNKCRKYYPNVYIENNKLFLPSFYEFYQKFGYKPCIGNVTYRVKGNFDLPMNGLNSITNGSEHMQCSEQNLSYKGDERHRNKGEESKLLNKGCTLIISSKKEDENMWNIWNLNATRSKTTNEKTVVWCSNDYLCLSNNQKVIDVGIETLKKIGNSSGGTRNISGSLLNHTHLEYILAKWFNKESALLFTSGYIANVGALETLGKLLNLVFVSDQMNHASIINGIRESRCEKYIFKHNDMVDLENILKKLRMDKKYQYRKIMIIFESIYSMSGNMSNIPRIVQLAKKYNALTYVDEVHAVGLYGKTGSGYVEELHLCDHIDIINGTLSKAIGSLGGFICANKYYIDVIRSYSPHFIFTTSLTPVNINTSAEAIYIIQNDINLRNKFRQVVQKTKKRLTQQGIHIMDNDSHIVVALINCAEKCKQICDDLLTEHNIYIQPINYPTVPSGSERIRITPSPYHTDEHIEELAKSLYHVFKKYEVNLFDKGNRRAEMKL
ncbi:5-aminolevulinic acid synthase [Plasmodium gonderi]|uniref:5-aminolevulinate synthase n=1 Tax=Plasmodium gonderi TaxID=77519 RepID=A0A1Y1JTU7_PLAGO|nr:5-aminolevulinic acid synthase [Plasmodium gonderi]GAW83823.1 5-aminolevulinic acid synthase [Plasmodium gonderi]